MSVGRQGVRTRLPAASVLLFAAGAAAWPLLVSQALGEIASTYVVNALILVVAASGLHVLVHWGGQVSLAHAAFMGVGAFVTARANADFGLPLPLAIAAGTAAAVVASLLLGLPALRIKGFALAVVTLAFGFASLRWLFVQPWLVPQVSGIPLRSTSLVGFDVTKSEQLLIPFGWVATAVVAATAVLGSSALGRRLRLMASDEEVAASYGIDVAAHKLLAFLYAGGCAGLAGGLLDVSFGRVGPSAFTVQDSVLLLAAVLLGGAGSVYGPVQAAAGFALAPALGSTVGRYLDLIGPLAILIVVLAAPGGLNGLAGAVKNRFASTSDGARAAATPRASRQGVKE